MAGKFWLSDCRRAAIEPHLPKKRPNHGGSDDRRVISGIIHVLRSGCRGRDVPAETGARGSRRRFRRRNVRGPARDQPGRPWHRLKDSAGPSVVRQQKKGRTPRIGRSRGRRRTKIHLSTDGKRRPHAFQITSRQFNDVRTALSLLAAVPPGRTSLADTAYDSNGRRQFLIERGILPVIPNNPTGKRPHPFDNRLYLGRNIERTNSHLKDWRAS